MRNPRLIRAGRRWLAPVLLLAACAQAQRSKPAFDPETKDGLLIEHILQERDAAEKLRYMEQFAAQYPSHNAIAWVYDQLQPAYFEVKEYDQAIRIGVLRLAIEPENLDAAKIALRAAEAKKDTEQMIKWADRVWSMAAARKSSAGAPEDQDYAEFCLYTAAMDSSDLKTRLAVLQGLEQRNAGTRYVHSFPAEYFRIYQQLGNQEKAVAMAEQGLKIDPANIDMLMALDEFHFHRENPKERQVVIEISQKLIGILDTAQRPASVSDEEWAHQKEQTLGMAYYMAGIASSLNLNFRQADHMLRLALAHMKDTGNDTQMAGLLYHLGMANYRLAENSKDRSRPADALKYLRRCAAIRGPYQEQAAKNVEGIRAEYNLP